jgi:hypothetical protein
MSDGWTNGKGRTLLNFLVHCLKGSMFIKSVDAYAHVKDAALLCKWLHGFIEEICARHVVQIMTDNATNYVVFGRMFMERHGTMFWTPYAAHCIDLMVEDVGKIPLVKEVIDQAKRIPKFIYNHGFVLNLTRTYIKDRELRRLAVTRFATHFLTLQCLLQCQYELKQMFVFGEWRDCKYSRRVDGRAIAKLVYSDSFWEGVEEVCSVVEPLVKVLRLVDGDKLITGYLYEAKKSIWAYYEGKGTPRYNKQMMIWDLIDSQ